MRSAQENLAHRLRTSPDAVGAKAARKLKAQRNPTPGVWFGLGMMGLIGWSVVVPTLLGAALGLWIDKQLPGTHSWTLALLVGGLTLGCFNAWHWVAKEERAMRERAGSRRIAMNEPLALGLAVVAGLLLGAIFFGGLWWTLRKGLQSPRPASVAFGQPGAAHGSAYWSGSIWSAAVIGSACSRVSSELSRRACS